MTVYLVNHRRLTDDKRSRNAIRFPIGCCRHFRKCRPAPATPDRTCQGGELRFDPRFEATSSAFRTEMTSDMDLFSDFSAVPSR